jgi:hypothetical protein
MSWIATVWGWVAATWGWLDGNSKSIGALASIVFGVSSAFIAVMAYRLSRANVIGLPPLIVVYSHGQAATADGASATAEFEVINRRKYPIMLASMTLHFRHNTLKFDDDDYSPPINMWKAKDERTAEFHAEGEKEKPIEPGKSVSFEVKLPIGDGSIEEPRIVVRYLDPHRGTWVETASAGESFRVAVRRAGLRRAMKAKLLGKPLFEFDLR